MRQLQHPGFFAEDAPYRPFAQSPTFCQLTYGIVPFQSYTGRWSPNPVLWVRIDWEYGQYVSRLHLPSLIAEFQCPAANPRLVTIIQACFIHLRSDGGNAHNVCKAGSKLGQIAQLLPQSRLWVRAGTRARRERGLPLQHCECNDCVVYSVHRSSGGG